ncbi:MAG TPA: hypothetical protein VFE62_15815 [Gemmataceae bacterium]|nr:hypothetical protein [Gemmataceae bacterium]
MLFSVIYSVDVCADDDVLTYAPPQVEDIWDQTEDDEQFEYAYLEGRWEGGHHRKWCAILTREQFDKFIDRCGLAAEDVQTMGSLGAPGCGFGWAPAISFTSSDPDAIQTAYVTPLPEIEKENFDDRDWERLRGAVVAVYG